MGRERIGCFRELQSSIKDSVHQVIKEQIFEMGLAAYFKITDDSIVCRTTGAHFIFKGLRHNAMEIKSTEGITICWVEEAQLVSEESWQILIPTIRVQGSEIWISFNPVSMDDPTYKRFVANPPPNAYVLKVGWQDNPFFSETQNIERLWLKENDYDAYTHVWEGECRQLSDDVIFGENHGKLRWVIEAFEEPHDPPPERIFFGADWGYAVDPTTLMRFWKTGTAPNEELWISHEAWEVKCELDNTPALFDTVPGSRDWPIKADTARQETISYMSNQGFNISAAEKWPGCVEDRIEHLKAYKMIHIHERCKHMQFEARNYRFKRDRQTGLVLPVIIDKHNHCWDAIGYGLDGYIQQRGVDNVWARQ